jgi:hypothetical protein
MAPKFIGYFAIGKAAGRPCHPTARRLVKLTLTAYQQTDKIRRKENESFENTLRCGAVSDDCLVGKKHLVGASHAVSPSSKYRRRSPKSGRAARFQA